MRNLVVFLLLTLTITAYAQIRPIDREIADAKLRDGVTEREFVIGIGTAPKADPNAKKLAQAAAIEDVYKKVADNVQNILHASKDEIFHADVAEHYSTAAQMPVVPIRLPRIKRVRLSSHRSSDDTNTYAIVAFNRQEIIDLYTQKTEKLRAEINRTLAEGLGLGGDLGSAARQYLGTYRRYEELKEAELIIVGTEYKPNAKDAFEKLRDYMDTEGSQEETIDFLDNYFRNVSPLAINNPNAVAEAITTQFEMQGAVSPTTKVQLDEFTYGVTKVSTGFASVLVDGINAKMMGRWNPVLKTRLPNWNSYGLGSNVGARLTGAYWESGNKVTIRTTLRNATSGKGEFQAVAIVTFNKNALSNTRSDRYKPNNYEAISREQMIVAQGNLGRGGGSSWKPPGTPGGGPTPSTTPTGGSGLATTTPASGPTPSTTPTGGSGLATTTPVSGSTEPVVRNEGFNLQIKTYKGPGSQTYTIGERMRLYVQVNQPAYIRVAYQQNDRWSQLAADQRIDPAQVSQWLEIPGNFVCVEPAGIGQVLVAAKTEMFKPFVDFYYEDGHRYIGKRPAPAGTVTPEQKNAETVEVQYVLRSFVNKDFKENVAEANPTLRSFINTAPDPFTSNPTDGSTTSSVPVVMNNGANHLVGAAIESIYLTTVQAE